MDNRLEEIERQKKAAFRPPEVKLLDDLQLLLRYIFISILIMGFLIYLLSFIISSGNSWKQIKQQAIYLAFGFVIAFGILRALRLTMSQMASDPLMLHTMKTDNVRWHLRDLIELATSLEWDLFGLISSLFILTLSILLPS